jgi:DNA (cytosine-5)-methyltransferase 1
MSELVLSLFPGIGLLDYAFELEGFCIVRGPDLLWGGDVRRFHPPAGRFDGVIGGPPCQAFSQFRYVNPKCGEKHGNLIPDFERVVDGAQPAWFLMENVRDAPEPAVAGYVVQSLLFNNRWTGAEQHRERLFRFGTRDGRRLIPDVALFESPVYERAVTASGGSTVAIKLGGSGKVKRTHMRDLKYGIRSGDYFKMACLLQGLPADFLDEAPFTVAGKIHVIGNGVPVPMGRAMARAVRRALGLPVLESEAV